MNIFKKRNWLFYLIEFVFFAVAFFLVDLWINGSGLRHAVISGLVSSVFFTVLFWFFDQGHKQIKEESKKEKTEDKEDK